MRVPQLKKKIGSPLGWSIRADPGDWIELRNVRQVFHSVGGPCVTVCAGKLDARRDRAGIGLVDHTSANGENVLHLAAHVDIREDQSGPTGVLACYSASRTTRIRVLAERSIREAAQECTGVIDSDLFDFARERMLTLLDECFGHRAHGLDSTVEPDGRVNAVRQ